MRYIENFELREWVKDSLRKTIFQKAHALSIQTGCEILIKLRDDNDELTGQQCYATGSLQKAYLNNVLRKEPGEFFVSGETGQPLMDQGIQSDESAKTSSGQGTPVHPVSSPLAMSDSSVTETATQFTSIQAHDTSRKHSSSQVTDFHSSVDTIDYPDPDGAKDDPMEDDEPPGGNDDDDDIVTRIKIEPSEDLDNISALPPSGDDVSDTDNDMKTILDDIDDDVEQDTEDIEPSSPVSEGSGNQQESRHSIKPYQCSICSKSFRSIQVLQKHSQTMHRHGIVKSQGFKPKPSPTKRKLGGSTTRKHGGKVSAIPQTLLHACSMCNQRFTESILLNDHIVKVHLNMDAINPPSAPFTQSQPPGTPEFGNVQGIPDPQMPQITSVSSLGTFPQTMNPAPSTATSSFSQSPMGPGPSTSDGSGSTQGTNFGTNLFSEENTGILDKGSKKRPKVYFGPRVINMPEPGKYLLGGHPELKRDLADYRTILEKVSCYRRTTDAENGRLLCMRLLREEFTTSELAIKNVTGVSRISIGQEKTKIVSFPKLDTDIIEAIFSQAKHQFPGFTDSATDTSCKTMHCLNGICKSVRQTMFPNKDERNMIMHPLTDAPADLPAEPSNLGN